MSVKVAVPYAPTRKGKAAERRAKQVAGPYRSQSSVPAIRRAATPYEHRSVANPFDAVDAHVAPHAETFHRGAAAFHVAPLANLLASSAHQQTPVPPSLVGLSAMLRQQGLEDPLSAFGEAQRGVEPPAVARRTYRRDYGPGLYGELAHIARRSLAAKEGIHADPLAETLISALATAGLGGVAGAIEKGTGAALGAAEGSSAASEAGLAERAAKGLAGLQSLPSRTVQGARELPTTLRSEAEALATQQGRRLAARRAGGLAQRQAYAHPILSGTGVLAGVHRAGIPVPGGRQADALLTGHLDALLNNPIGTAETTGRALAGSIAALGGLAYSAGQSAVEADPHAFLNTAGSQLQGLGAIAGHLLSGDPREVQKAVEKEVGLSFLAPAPALSRLPLYERLRAGARDYAARGRAAFTDRTGIPLRVGPGEQHVFGRLQRHAERKEVARMVQRESLPERLRAAHYGRPVIQEARRIPHARSLGNLHGLEGGDLVQTLAEYGVTREGARHQLQLLREHGPVGDAPGRGDVTLRGVLDFADQHPEVLANDHLWKAVDAYRASVAHLPQQMAGHGERAAVLAQGDLFGVRPPELRTPHAAREFTQAPDRAGAWRDLTAREKQAKTLRHEARTKLVQANEREAAGHVTVAKNLREEGKKLYVDARQLEEKNRAFRKALHPYSRPGAAVSSRARRKLWDPALVKEYREEVAAAAAPHGLAEGVYTHHAPLRQEGEIAESARQGNAATRVQHIRRAPSDPLSLAGRDAVDRSLHSLVVGSIEGPRMRAAGQALARRFFSQKSVPLKVGEETKRRVTQEEFAQAIRDGQVSEKHYVWVPERQYKQAYTSPQVGQAQLHAEAHSVLQGEILRESRGAKGVVVPREAFKEYSAQINPTKYVGERVFNAISKGAGRVLLFSPAWILSQVAAEGIPIFMAHPELLNPAKVVQLERRLKEFNDLHPDEAMGFAATMGEAPVRAATARELQPTFSPTHEMFSNGARAIEHNPIGRALFSTARLRPFVLFDQWRHGKFQTILAAAEADKRFNGFLSGLQGALRTEKGLSDELRHMSPVDQLHALTQPRYRSELDKLEKYQEAITGNWTAFTRYERAFSPFAVFYGFIRYAFRWPLTFAKAHPMTATLNYFLAQQNANQIEKLLGGHKPAEFYQYANPVVEGPHGEKSWLPGGARIAPGLSAPAQGLLGGNAPSAVVGSVNPLYGALVGLVTGTTAFGTHDENEGALGLHWSLAAQELMQLPPVARLFGIGQSQSPTAKELRHLDPNRAARGFAAPWLPQSGHDARQSNEIIRALEAEAQGGSSSTSTNPFDKVSIGGGSGSSTSSNPFDKVTIP